MASPHLNLIAAPQLRPVCEGVLWRCDDPSLPAEPGSAACLNCSRRGREGRWNMQLSTGSKSPDTSMYTIIFCKEQSLTGGHPVTG